MKALVSVTIISRTVTILLDLLYSIPIPINEERIRGGNGILIVIETGIHQSPEIIFGVSGSNPKIPNMLLQ